MDKDFWQIELYILSRSSGTELLTFAMTVSRKTVKHVLILREDIVIVPASFSFFGVYFCSVHSVY